MKNFNVGETVVVPSGRHGVIKKIDGSTAIVWFDSDGNDSGHFSIPTLSYPSKLTLVTKG